jgi:hypothetical protein
MATHDRQVLTKILLGGASKFAEAEARGFIPSRLAFDEDRDLLAYIAQQVRDHGEVPSQDQVDAKFPKFMPEDSEAKLSSLLEEWAANYARAATETFFIGDLAPAVKAGASPERMAELVHNYADELASVGKTNGHVRGEMICFDTIPPEATRWLWPGFIVEKSLNVICADPKVGKGLLSVWKAAQMTRGWRGWDKRNCAFLGHEDSLGTQSARLVAAGADMSRVYALRGRDGAILTLPSDAAEIRRYVEEFEIGCLFVDPINSHTDSGIRTSDDKSMREVLSPLALIAQECDTIVIVVHHFSKGTLGQKTLYRLGGSMAYSGVARSVLALGRKEEVEEQDDEHEEDEDRPSPFLTDSPDENSRYLFQCGTNYYGDVTPVRFDIKQVEVEVTDGHDDVAKFVYVGEDDSVSEADIFTGSVKRGRGRPKDNGLRAWLAKYIDGKDEVAAQDLYDAAHADGHSDRTVRDVLRREMGWTSERRGRVNVWREPNAKVLQLVPKTEASTDGDDE